MSAHEDNKAEQDGDTRVLPPLLATDSPRSAAESVRLARKRIRLVDQEIEALAALQDRLDVLDHDVLAGIVSCGVDANKSGVRWHVRSPIGHDNSHIDGHGTYTLLRSFCACRIGSGGGAVVYWFMS